MEIDLHIKPHGEAGGASITQLVNELCPSKKAFSWKAAARFYGEGGQLWHQGELWMTSYMGHCSLMSGAGNHGWGRWSFLQR